MAEQKRKYPKLISPRLVLVFPKLSEPDFGSKDYPKPDGEYSTKGSIRADSPEAKAFLAALKPHYDAAMAEGHEAFSKLQIGTRKKLGKVTENDLFTTVYDKETEEPTGNIEFKFAMKASGTLKKGPKAGQTWNRKPDIFDARGVPMVKVPALWGGTVAKISFEASPYFIPGTGAAGLKLNLVAVQIIDLVSGGQRNAASHGFGTEEGGYSYEEPAEDTNSGGFSDEGGADDVTPSAEPQDF
jgi:hypothetical protein